MTLPNPYAQPQLLPFEVDLSTFFADVSAHIRASRVRRQQPSLVPSGAVLVGQEYLAQYDGPPRIVVVPLGASFAPARHTRDGIDPTMLRSMWIECEAHCWGYDDPSGNDPIYGFSTAIELWRQLFDAMQRINKGVPNVRDTGGQFVQVTDKNRNGRMLNVSFAIWSALVKDPPIYVPIKTATTPGADFDITASLESADGSEVQQEAQFTVP